MKKSAAAVAFALMTFTSAVAFACPHCRSAFESPDCLAIIGMFSSVFWVPLALLTVFAFFLLRKRFASRRGLILSMIGAFPFSALAVLSVIDFIAPVLETALDKQSLIMASAAGCLTAINAGYVAGCYLLGRGPNGERNQ